ncbi:hypothetical protein [Cysteiniphilum litorale]|uniref:hypothetical protein n=1 Tax=Cysteiniphilum litorale TaxID=2056700 RepID=UPI003F8836CB
MNSFKKACSSLALISVLSATAVSAFAGNQNVFPYNNPALMNTLSKYQINPAKIKEVSLGKPTILNQSQLDKIMQQEQIFFEL